MITYILYDTHVSMLTNTQIILSCKTLSKHFNHLFGTNKNTNSSMWYHTQSSFLHTIFINTTVSWYPTHPPLPLFCCHLPGYQATLLLAPPWTSSYSSVATCLDIKPLFCCLPGYQVYHGASIQHPPTRRDYCSGWCFSRCSSCIHHPSTIVDSECSLYSCFAFQSTSYSYSSTFSFSAMCICFNSQSSSYSYSSTHFSPANC
jgi:hypothetical protein